MSFAKIAALVVLVLVLLFTAAESRPTVLSGR